MVDLASGGGVPAAGTWRGAANAAAAQGAYASEMGARGSDRGPRADAGRGTASGCERGGCEELMRGIPCKLYTLVTFSSSLITKATKL